MIETKLLQRGESLSASCYSISIVKRPAYRHYLSDASFEAVGGYCLETRIYWRYDLPQELTEELHKKAQLRRTCTITINLLELSGMMVTARVILALVHDRPENPGDPILMRGDNLAAAVMWVNRCGGA